MFISCKKWSRTALFAVFLMLLAAAASAQKKSKKKIAAAADTAKAKSLAQQTASRPVTGLKPYKEVVPAGAKSMRSFISIHLVSDHYLFELPDSILGRDILVVTRINKAPADFKIPLVNIGYGGDETGKAVIRFEKIPGDKMVMRSVSFRQFSNDTTSNGLSRSLANSNYQTIQGTFPVKAVNQDAKSTVIDLTDFINGDNGILSFSEPFIRNLIGNLIMDRAFISDIKAFPSNVEIKSVKTYNSKPSPLGTPPPNSFEFNNSLILLPFVPMKPRMADPRIGFFSNAYADFDTNPFGAATTRYIQRWRLEPKPGDLEKYKSGELVEPQKPIVIYIDPATPKKWVPYLIAGINDWQVAFEKAGFKNAITGREAPLNDSTWSLEDARHSVLVYKPSEIANASGPNVNDPRSGEILETHINWYHSVMTLLRNWYTVQAAAVDPRTHKPELDDALMGQLIRFVSSHEIGHTLGLMHNFGASSTVPVEKLRNKAWVEAHGHTPSIMDYARFNYIAQPEDGIGEKGIFPRIGDYDKWAIEWGYRLIPEAKTAADEKPVLNKWLVNKLASGKQYFYGSQLNPFTNDFPMNDLDPRSQSEDLGDDPVLAGSYAIKNLKRIVPHLTEWFSKPGENYDQAAEMYQELVTHYGRLMGHVLKNIGGMYQTPKTVEQSGPEYDPVPVVRQRKAMAFLQQQLFTTPYWLMNKKLFESSRAGFPMVTRVQQQVLSSLLSSRRINIMISAETDFPGRVYTAAEMLRDLRSGIFSELASGRPVPVYRRDLQKVYVESLIPLLDIRTAGGTSDCLSLLKAHSRDLAAQIKKAIPATKDGRTKAHLTDLHERLWRALHPEK